MSVMSTNLYCQSCGKHLATLRDAKVRNGMVVYCGQCNDRLHPRPAEMPEFFKKIFGRGE